MSYKRLKLLRERPVNPNLLTYIPADTLENLPSQESLQAAACSNSVMSCDYLRGARRQWAVVPYERYTHPSILRSVYVEAFARSWQAWKTARSSLQRSKMRGPRSPCSHVGLWFTSKHVEATWLALWWIRGA